MDGYGYPIEQASRVNEIGFAEFTADLIHKTFQAIIEADLAQRQDFASLLEAVSKTASEYINETKLELSGEEVLSFLENLPPFVDRKGEEMQAKASDGALVPITFQPGQSVPAQAVHQLNKGLDIGQIAGGVVDVLGGIKELFGPKDIWLDTQGVTDKPVYDPAALLALIEGQAPAEQPHFQIPKDDPNDAVGALYEAVAERISLNKYTLLKDLVKLGRANPLVMRDGKIRTTLHFHAWERQYESNAAYEQQTDRVKSKLKTKEKSPGGIFGFLRGRSKSRAKKKSTQVYVRTRTENQSYQSGSETTITGMVELNFATDYQPVSTI